MLTTTLDEQIDAAVADTRSMVATALPDTRNITPSMVMPPWVRDLLDQLTGPRIRRCAHLGRRPVQPWLTSVSDGMWRCRPCASGHAVAEVDAIAHGRRILDPVEEGTCDRCRRNVDPDALTGAVIRAGLWVLVAALCGRCMRDAVSDGGHLVASGRRSR